MFKDLYKSQNFEVIIDLHRQLNNTQDYEEWDYFYLASAFNKLQQYKYAYEIGLECKRKFKEFKNINNVIGWSLYYGVIKNFNEEVDNVNNILKCVDYITTICEQEKFSPYELVVQKIIKIIYSKVDTQIDYRLGNKYLDLLDPDKLSNEQRVVKKDGIEKKVMSERENWYLKKTKSLYELKMYSECLEIINNKLPVEKEFYSTPSVLIRGRFSESVEKILRYRQACCYIALSDYITAKKILLDLTGRFTDWWIYEKLYQIYKNKGKFKSALKNASIALLRDNQHKARVKMLEDVGDYLMNNGYTKEAQYHYSLVRLVRKEEGWKESNRMETLINDETVKLSDKRDTLKYLNDFWKTYKYMGVKFRKGTIDRIMEGGTSGFVNCTNGNRYYFVINSFLKKPKNINIGDRVKFIPTEGFDKKKNRKSLQATDIEFIK